MRVNKPGIYYGQCNQICGINHAYMPIAVEALPKAEFERWVADAKRKFAAAPDGAVRVAASGEQPGAAQ
jgi:cytochrome c oxidase subunit 2